MTRQQRHAQKTKSGVVVVNTCMAPRYSRAGGGGERGEELAGAAGAEAPAHRGGDHHQRGEAERGEDPEAGERVPVSAVAEPGQERSERRLVDVAERRCCPADRKYSSSRT